MPRCVDSSAEKFPTRGNFRGERTRVHQSESLNQEMMENRSSRLPTRFRFAEIHRATSPFLPRQRALLLAKLRQTTLRSSSPRFNREQPQNSSRDEVTPRGESTKAPKTEQRAARISSFPRKYDQDLLPGSVIRATAASGNA